MLSVWAKSPWLKLVKQLCGFEQRIVWWNYWMLTQFTLGYLLYGLWRGIPCKILSIKPSMFCCLEPTHQHGDANIIENINCPQSTGQEGHPMAMSPTDIQAMAQDGAQSQLSRFRTMLTRTYGIYTYPLVNKHSYWKWPLKNGAFP